MSHRAAVRCSLLTCCGLVVATPVASQSAERTALVRGVVYDSLFSTAPLAGAEVWIEGTNRTARTDAAGRFELSALAAGRYTLTFYHPLLDSTGLAARPVIVEVADGRAVVVVLATPGPTAVHHMLCPEDPWRDTGVVLGLVRDATAGTAIAGVTMFAEWTTYVVGEGPARRVPRAASARSDAAGRVVLCNVPTDVALVLRGRAGEGPAGMLLVDMAGRAFGLANLRLAATSATGTVTGVVRNRDGSLVAGATVVAIGTKARTRADQFGRFTLDDVMAGSHIVETRAIGYPPAHTQTSIRPGLMEQMDIVMGDSLPIMLDPVTVEGDYEPYLARMGFNRRRNSAQGHFLDTTDIHRSQALRFEEVFRMIPGARLRPNGSGYLVELQRGEGQILNPALARYCPPSYFIDGVYFPLPPLQTPSVPVVPEEILAIEVYSNILSAPPQYQRRDGACGVILVWTKRGVPNRNR
jgi:carboxypeptidase family protein